MEIREIEAVVDQTVAECKAFFLKNGWVDSKWTVDVKTSFSGRRNRSWGGMKRGRSFISLALSGYMINSATKTFPEYRSFAHDKEIGTYVGSVANCLRALIIHEMCHAIQFTGSAASAFKMKGEDTRGHGALWKTLYRQTRNTLLNYRNEANIPVVKTATPKAKPVKKIVDRQQNAMGRQEALMYIRSMINRGFTKSEVINLLVTKFDYKKTTATTYVYSVK